MSITTNILRQCKDGLGGVDVFYILPWYKYSRSQIVVTGQTLTTFPTSTIYSVEAESVAFTESSSFEGGSEKWSQSFSFDYPKTVVTNELYKLLRQNVRIFYIDYLGNIRVLGLYNGLEAQITNESGTDKASMNGYKIVLTGDEDNQAYFADSLPTIGVTPDVIDNYVFQDGNNKIYQDGNNVIFQ